MAPRLRTRVVRQLPVFGLLVVAAVLRLAFIGSGSLFFDEAWHMEVSNGRGSFHLRLPVNRPLPDVPNCLSLSSAAPWWQIPAHMDWLIHPPLYHLLLRPWRAVVGESGIAARCFSVVWSLLAIVVAFDLVRRLHGMTAALWACALMGVAGTQVWIAQEARGYTMLMALGLCALWCAAGILRRGPSWPRVIGLGVAALAMLLTHYFAAGALAGLGLFAIVSLRGRARWAVLGALSAAGLCFAIVWGPTLREQLTHVQESADIFLKEPPQGHVARTAWRVAAMPARLIGEPGVGAGGLAIVAVLAVAFVGAVVIAWTPREHEATGERSELRGAVMLWLAWLIGGVGSIAALDLARGTLHLEFIRYTAVASPAVYALFAAATSTTAANRPAWRRDLIPAVACVAALVMLPAAYRRDDPDLGSLGAAGAELARRAPADAPLIIASPNPLGRDGQTLYLGLCVYGDALFPRTLLIPTRPVGSELLSKLPRRDVALVQTANRTTPPQNIVPGCAVIDARVVDAGAWYLIRLPRAAPATTAVIGATCPRSFARPSAPNAGTPSVFLFAHDAPVDHRPHAMRRVLERVAVIQRDVGVLANLQ